MFLVQVIALDSDDFEMTSKNYRCQTLTVARRLQTKIIDMYARRYLAEDWDAPDSELAEIDNAEIAEWKEENVSFNEDGNASIYGFDAGHAEVNIVELNEVVTAATVDTVKIETPYAY